MFTSNLKRYRALKGISQKELASRVFISQQAYAKYETGTASPNPDLLGRIASELGVSVDELLKGSSVSKQIDGGVWINVLGDVAAGIPIEAVENIVDQEEISIEMAEHGEHFALRIKGNSMEPRMHEGDVVIVRRQEDATDGDVCVILVNGDSATVKKIRKRPDGILLIPFNTSFEPLFFNNLEISTLPVVILGKVVELRAKF